MSITDELRESMSHCISDGWMAITKSAFEAVADRIDAEHDKVTSRMGQLLALLADAEKDRDYNYANWQDCKQKVLQGNITFNELNTKIECLVDALSRCIELPVDADGEVIRIGDVMERGEARGRVIALMLSNYPKKWGGELHWGIQLEGEQAPTAFDGLFHHYHALTVEDVLREFGDWYAHARGGCDEDGIVAEYAAKLRLANSEE